MKYNDTTNQQGLLQMLRAFTKADENTLPETDARLFLNLAIDEYSDIVMMHNPDWQYDDGNWGDLPIGTADIKSGKYDYKFNDSFLMIRRIEVKDAQGTASDLIQVREQELADITNKHATNNGVPRWFYLKGNYVNVFPTPDYAQDEGLIIHYERGIKHLDGSDDQRVGIPSIHQKYVVMRASVFYAVKENLKSMKSWKTLADEQEKKIKEFFSRRNRNLRPRLSVRRTSSK